MSALRPQRHSMDAELQAAIELFESIERDPRNPIRINQRARTIRRECDDLRADFFILNGPAKPEPPK